MIAIVDYGVGNLFSIASGCRAVGAETVLTADPGTIAGADGVILPGVGAFGDAMEKLRATGLDRTLQEFATTGKTLLGICLGMQLLFEEGLEFGIHKGLGLLPGTIRPFAGKLPPELKIPQMGWNPLHILRPHPLLINFRDGDCVYYVHSYYADCPENLCFGISEYGIPLPGLVGKGNICGCQFHPEKSGSAGLRILRAFAEMEGVC
ncbi:MAG: imidazole glycerol phosphate synthase subunit HisH [Christensenellales bacterium]